MRREEEEAKGSQARASPDIDGEWLVDAVVAGGSKGRGRGATCQILQCGTITRVDTSPLTSNTKRR